MEGQSGSPRRRRWLLTVVIVIIIAGVVTAAVTGDDEPKSTPAASTPAPQPTARPRPTLDHPHFEVVGQCVSGRGTLFGRGAGFTPNGRYVTEAWYPNGKPYARIGNPGHASAKGTTPNWRWTCEQDDPPGEYEVHLIDLESAERSNHSTFEIGKP
jgi:hypothetical protein